jgi:hypothetical protein
MSCILSSATRSEGGTRLAYAAVLALQQNAAGVWLGGEGFEHTDRWLSDNLIERLGPILF